MSPTVSAASNTVTIHITKEYYIGLQPLTTESLSMEKILQRFINQMLVRDGYKGGWTQVVRAESDNGDEVDSASGYSVTITCADRRLDISGYNQILLNWLEAVALAYADYTNIYLQISPPPPSPPDPRGVSFLPPFGLAIKNTKAVQLLHYPPSETLLFWDYLYSPTNRRWETLLEHNGGFLGQEELLESIVDLVPICADGGDSGTQALRPWTDGQPGGTAFGNYITAMLTLLLSPSGSGQSTAPIIGFGGPVLEWLEAVYQPVDISPVVNAESDKLQPLSLFTQSILGQGQITPILCANHPALFMYYKPSQKDHFMTILLQDLTAARWQIKMAQNPGADPVETLKDAWDYWNSTDQAAILQLIFEDQISEFVRP